MDTPSIKFAEGSASGHVFNATPEGGTPRRRIDKLISPGSATKVKRSVKVIFLYFLSFSVKTNTY